MSFPIEKYINLYTLGAVNVGIILAAELSGSALEKNGAIHLISLFFALIAIALYPRLSKYLSSDNFLKSFLKKIFPILIILSLIHLFEYLMNFFILPFNDEYTDAIILGLYVVIILLIVVAVEYLLSSWRRNSKWLFDSALILIFALGSILVYALALGITDREFRFITYAEILFLFLFGIFSMVRILKLKTAMTVLRNFINYFLFTILFVVLSGLFEFFEIENLGGLPPLQNTYLSHFFIFLAISCYILGLTKLLKPGGVYNDIKHSLSGKVNR
jgi:hypothetical protein